MVKHSVFFVEMNAKIHRDCNHKPSRDSETLCGLVDTL